MHSRRLSALWLLTSACPCCPPLGHRHAKGSPPALRTKDQRGGPSPKPHVQLGQARKKQQPASDPPRARELWAEKSPWEEGDWKRDRPHRQVCQEHGPHEAGQRPAEEGGGAGRGWESSETGQGPREARAPGQRARAGGAARVQLPLRVLHRQRAPSARASGTRTKAFVSAVLTVTTKGKKRNVCHFRKGRPLCVCDEFCTAGSVRERDLHVSSRTRPGPAVCLCEILPS